jgi:hypothetical protein
MAGVMSGVVPNYVGLQVRVHGLLLNDCGEPWQVRKSATVLKIGIDLRLAGVYFVANG